MGTKKFTEKPELCINNTLTQNTENIILKTENLKHISGIENTSQISSPSDSPLRGTRGASISSEEQVEVSTEELYKEAARRLQVCKDIYYIKVCLKGRKQTARQEVNVDIVLEEDTNLIFKYKSNMVGREFMHEIYRDLAPTEQGPAWDNIKQLFEHNKNNANMYAGKLRNRRTYKSIPKGRIPNCAIAVVDFTAHVYLGNKYYQIDLSDSTLTNKAKMIFTMEGSITNYVDPEAYNVEVV